MGNKKWLGLLIALVMIISTACSNNTNETQSPQIPQQDGKRIYRAD